MVKQIQKAVGAYPDGIWGPATTEAVKAFQRAHSLVPDGIAGLKTLAVMGISALGSQEPPKSGQEGMMRFYSGQAITLRKSKRRIDYIAVHCTATPEGRSLTVDQIRTQHKAQGWSDIGYHYIIYRDGTVHAGRNVDISGAHVSGYNSYSIGVAYVGGLENRPGVAYAQLKAKDTRTVAQKASLLALLVDLRKLYPHAVIQGHRDFSPDKNGDGIISADEWIKECPSFEAKTEYRNV